MSRDEATRRVNFNYGSNAWVTPTDMVVEFQRRNSKWDYSAGTNKTKSSWAMWDVRQRR